MKSMNELPVHVTELLALRATTPGLHVQPLLLLLLFLMWVLGVELSPPELSSHSWFMGWSP